MKKLILLLTLFPLKLFAVTDYSFEGVFRSFPVGGFAKAKYGYALPIYGKIDKKNPLYGYLRAEGSFQSSGIINSGFGTVEFFPISILGFYAQRSYMLRYTSVLDTFDCDQVVCDGRLERNAVGTKAVIGAFGFFAMYDFKRVRVEMKNRNGTFVDESVTLLARPGNDVVDTHILIAGYALKNNWRIGILDMRNQMKYARGDSSMTMGMVQFPFKKDHTLGIATGRFLTRDEQNVWSSLVLWKWNAKRGAPFF